MKKITNKQKRIAYVDVTAELFISAIQKHYESNLPDDAEVLKVELALSDMVYSDSFHGHTLRFFLCSKEFNVRQEGSMIPRHDVIVGQPKLPEITISLIDEIAEKVHRCNHSPTGIQAIIKKYLGIKVERTINEQTTAKAKERVCDSSPERQGLRLAKVRAHTSQETISQTND